MALEGTQTDGMRLLTALQYLHYLPFIWLQVYNIYISNIVREQRLKCDSQSYRIHHTGNVLYGILLDFHCRKSLTELPERKDTHGLQRSG